MAFDPSQFGATPVAASGSSFDASKFGATLVTSAPAAAPSHQSLADLTWSQLAGAGKAVSSIFPGAQLGKALGTSLYGIGSAAGKALHGDFAGAGQAIADAGNENNANFGKVVGDVGQAVALPVSMALGGGGGATVAGRIGNAALKYGAASALSGASGKLAKGGSAGDAAAAGLTSGVTGLAGGALGQGLSEGLSAALTNLPSRLVKNALPKLSSDNTDSVLQNTHLGSVDSMLKDSEASVSNLGDQVQTILKHPEYATDTGAGNFALEKTLNAFPNSEYTPDQIVSTVKKLVPGQAKLVDKVANGTATLIEKNTLRSAIDPIIKKVFTDAPEVSASKQIGAEFANALRAEVQSFAPETQSVFANLSKEIDLRNALAASSKKLAGKSALSLYDIVAGLGGLTTSGPVGAIGAIAAEKALRSPAVGIAAAKGLQKVIPAAAATLNAGRGPLITGAASSLGQGTAQQPQ